MSIDPAVTAYFIHSAKQALEISAQEGENFLPIVGFRWIGETDVNVAAHPYDVAELPKALQLVVVKPLDFVAYLSDTWFFRQNADDDAYPGKAREMFEAGNPDAMEALAINIVTEDSVNVYTLPYERDGATITWLPPVKDEASWDAGGRVIDWLRAAMEFSRGAGR